MTNLLGFYKGKKILVTGHTGFKGTWLCKILINAGAEVVGYALEPNDEQNLFMISGVERHIKSIIGDIRDFESLRKVFSREKPEIAIHLAAQAIVRDAYINPRYTYETNVMGTVNLLECTRESKSIKSVINVTTDKVYQNNEWEWGYRENETLNGFDPYSNSKSCSELVTQSYIKSFFTDTRTSISTARAGNVIGGGDFSRDRIIPDCIRAAEKKESIIIRNPNSIRPYQHVLEALYAYLMIAEKQFNDIKYAGYYNIGPNESDCITTGQLADLFCSKWGDGINWVKQDFDGPFESQCLKLDCSKLKKTFSWEPKWNISEAVEKTIDWSKGYLNNESVENSMDKQIEDYIK